MFMTGETLKKLIEAVILESFGTRTFRRRHLMELVEQRIGQMGAWQDGEGVDVASGGKSKGLAKIDFAISALAREGTIVAKDRGEWAWCVEKALRDSPGATAPQGRSD